MKFEVTREIAARPEAIWSVLINSGMLQNGTFGITRIAGVIASGNKITVWSEVSPRRAFPLKVTEFAPPRLMVWQGGMPFGLFKGVRTFSLTPSASGAEFHMQEEYFGPLAGLIAKSIPDLSPSFEKFADGLKAAAEGK